jgi:RNA polymerase sigma factor (sigma-70 family)
MFERDPLADPEPLIRRVYRYVAYRIGAGPEADDVVGDTFERAVRYRDSYDHRKGPPAAWLIGIARGRIADLHLPTSAGEPEEDVAAPGDMELEFIERQDLERAVGRLGDRDRELIALRYGADLSAREIAKQLGMETNAVEVALHRALGRLRTLLGGNST